MRQPFRRPTSPPPAARPVGTLRAARAAFPKAACLGACMLMTSVTVTSLAAAQARPLLVAGASGALEAAQRTALFAPFTAATGIPVTVSPWDGSQAALEKLLADPNSAPDVLLMPGDLLRQACQNNQLEKINWDLLGGRDRFLPQGVSDCGLGAAIITVALAWDRDKYQPGANAGGTNAGGTNTASATANSPNWQDFWDIARIPGKRGLRRGVRNTLEIALLADGVAPGDVYKTLRTDDGVDRAFRKLDQLRPYVVWWQTPAEAVRILSSGEVLLTTAPVGVVAQAAAHAPAGRNLAVQWNGSLASVSSWAVRHDTPELDQAQKFLKFAADPTVEAQLQATIPYGGLARGANDALPPDVATWSTGLPAHLAAGLMADEGFWHDNAAKLTQRFEEWLAK